MGALRIHSSEMAFFGPTQGGLASQALARPTLKISNRIQALGRITGRGASLEGGQACAARERAITQ